jgi:hypothetical protein
MRTQGFSKKECFKLVVKAFQHMIDKTFQAVLIVSQLTVIKFIFLNKTPEYL